MNRYDEFRAKRQAEFDKLPLIFAFTKEGFKEGMAKQGLTENDTDKIVCVESRSGACLAKKDLPLLHAFLEDDKINGLDNKMNDFDFAVDAFVSEMENHEYAINTYQGDWDTIMAIYEDAEDLWGSEKTYKDYLTELGKAHLIPAYEEAKKRYYKKNGYYGY